MAAATKKRKVISDDGRRVELYAEKGWASLEDTPAIKKTRGALKLAHNQRRAFRDICAAIVALQRSTLVQVGVALPLSVILDWVRTQIPEETVLWLASHLKAYVLTALVDTSDTVDCTADDDPLIRFSFTEPLDW